MKQINWKFALACLVGVAFVIGCDSNPTNAPTDDAIKAANVKRAAAIDNDPSMNAEQKKKMKEMLHLDGSKPTKPQ